MKSSYLLLSVTFLLFSSLLLGQGVDHVKSHSRQAATKGYYSIGNNAQKLSPIKWLKPDTFLTTNITKGYHSIGSQTIKLPKKSGWFGKNIDKPLATKGYYSIGNNIPKPDSLNSKAIVIDSSNISTSR